MKTPEKHAIATGIIIRNEKKRDAELRNILDMRSWYVTIETIEIEPFQDRTNDNLVGSWEQLWGIFSSCCVIIDEQQPKNKYYSDFFEFSIRFLFENNNIWLNLGRKWKG